MSGINLPLPQELLDRIAVAAKKQGRTLRQEIAHTLRRKYEPQDTRE